MYTQVLLVLIVATCCVYGTMILREVSRNIRRRMTARRFLADMKKAEGQAALRVSVEGNSNQFEDGAAAKAVIAAFDTQFLFKCDPSPIILALDRLLRKGH